MLVPFRNTNNTTAHPQIKSATTTATMTTTKITTTTTRTTMTTTTTTTTTTTKITTTITQHSFLIMRLCRFGGAVAAHCRF